MSHVIRIEDQSSLAEVRRIANRADDAEDLSTDARGRLALVISEACTNLVKHATGGEIHVAGLSKRYESGVEVLAIDRGPGIENLDRVMEDGFLPLAPRVRDWGQFAALLKHLIFIPRVVKAP